jgi:cyclophilin family peptidyl-prolyl cis-trans isomerase
VTVKLDAAAAPHTVNSFVFLADQHFFDGVYYHRLTTTGIWRSRPKVMEVRLRRPRPCAGA